MDVPTSEVGYTSATTGRGDHEVHKGHVVALDFKKMFHLCLSDIHSSLSTLVLCTSNLYSSPVWEKPCLKPTSNNRHNWRIVTTIRVATRHRGCMPE
jgi:hypothetical protein